VLKRPLVTERERVNFHDDPQELAVGSASCRPEVARANKATPSETD